MTENKKRKKNYKIEKQKMEEIMTARVISLPPFIQNSQTFLTSSRHLNTHPLSFFHAQNAITKPFFILCHKTDESRLIFITENQFLRQRMQIKISHSSYLILTLKQASKHHTTPSLILFQIEYIFCPEYKQKTEFSYDRNWRRKNSRRK